MLNKLFAKIDTISFAPQSQDTGDLEGATKTIIATSEAAGVGNADYSAALTLPVPSDSRLAITRVSTRLACTIDAITAAHLYCRVYVDAQDANHLLFDLDYTTTGAKLANQDTLASTKATIFALLKDGSAHTFYFFFWVDALASTISQVELWEGVGHGGDTSWSQCMTLTFSGQIFVLANSYQAGSGTANVIITAFNTGAGDVSAALAASSDTARAPSAVVLNPTVNVRNLAVTTDLAIVYNIELVLYLIK